MKVVISTVYGNGFMVDSEMAKMAGLSATDPITRTDPRLVAAVEAKLPGFDGLKAVDVPDDVDWVIEEYDGTEWVAERHRTWC